MTRDERPIAAVPTGVLAALALGLALQIAWQLTRGPAVFGASPLPPAPRAEALRLAGLGESGVAARLAMLYLQSFDLRGDNNVPYQRLDYGVLLAWLRAIIDTDPRSQYALFSAARLYAEIPDEAKSRRVLEFIHQEYLKDPERRWPWLAHAALLAKHRLRDLPLARRYAAEIDRHTKDPSVPSWARQMEIFILEDMNELEAAKIMIAGLLASGRLADPAEIRFLKGRLEELEKRIAAGQSGKR